MIKLMIVGRRRGGMTVAQLHRYMTDVHGPMVVRNIGAEPDLMPRRYVQNHVHDGSTRMPGPQNDPLAASRDFVTQVWFDDPVQARASLTAPFYRTELQPDEDRFVDQGSVVRLPSVEEPLHAGSGEGGGRSKLFVFHRCGAGVSVDDLAAATRALWTPLLAAPADHGIERAVRNRVHALPGETQAVDLVDEVWLSDDAAASRLGAMWQAWADGPALRPVLAPGSAVVLLAHERVMHAGAPAAT